MENKYAIILKRVSSDLVRNIHIYEIDKITKGQYFSDENIFIDEQNKKILTFENNKILNRSCKKFVCSILTENELLERYPSLSINESLNLCYMDFTKLITIVSYDYDNDEIKMISIDKINVINKVNKKDQEKDELSEFCSQAEENFGNNKFLITKNDYETLLEITDIKELLDYIKEIQNNKDLYEEKLSKLKSDDDWGMVVRNDYINPIYYLDLIIKMKKYLINLKETFVDNKEEKKISYVEYFSRMFSDLKEDVLSLDELDILKEFLLIQMNDIENSKKQFIFLKECGYQVDELLELLDIYSETMNKILKLNTVSSIHRAYKELYNNTEGLIISAGVTLDDAHNNESFELKTDEINIKYI